MMQLYPAIDIKGGQCVRLLQGNYEKETVYSEDPVSIAQRWVREGASYLHLVDLDGAKTGVRSNQRVIKQIVEAVPIPVQVGGGMRSLEAIEAQLSLGVARVILGSAAVKRQDLIQEAIKRFGPEKIVVGVDAKDGKVAVEGWLEVTAIEAITFIKKLQELGVKTVIYTDIATDGMLCGPNIKETKAVIDASGLEVIASGGISKLDDLEKLKDIGAQGSIIGKALYTDAIDLKQAIDRFEKGLASC